MDGREFEWGAVLIFNARLSRPSRDGKGQIEALLPAVGAAVTRTAAAALGLRLGDVDVQGPAVEVLAIQRVDGRFGLARIRHFHECEATGAASVAIRYQTGTFYRAVRFKKRANRRLCGSKAQITNENVCQLFPYTIEGG